MTLHDHEALRARLSLTLTLALMACATDRAPEEVQDSDADVAGARDVGGDTGVAMDVDVAEHDALEVLDAAVDTDADDTGTGDADADVPDVDAGVTCGQDEAVCDGACVDPGADDAHCGECGSACGTGERCMARACVCVEPFEVVAVSPSPNAVAVASGAPIEVTTRCRVAPESLTEGAVVMWGSQSGTIPVALATTARGLTVTPRRGAWPGESIVVTLSAGVRDRGDRPLSAYGFGFMTAVSSPSAGMFEQRTSGLGDVSCASVAIADLDGDGDLDALGAAYQDEVEVFLNAGDAQLRLEGLVSDTSSSTLALGDLDGDGVSDLVLAGEQELKWRRGDGMAGFQGVGARLGGLAQWVGLADLDLDGDLDIVAVGATEVVTWVHDGAGGFERRRQGSTPRGSRSAIGDLDGDGAPDLFVANREGPERVWLNDGHGALVETAQALGAADGVWTALGDVDGDGDLDAVVANFGAPTPALWLNDGHGAFVDGQLGVGSLNSISVAMGDLDGDGDLDLYVGHGESSSSSNRVLLNDGHGHFADSGQRLGSLNTYAVQLADLDGDGDLDAFDGNWGVVGQRANQVWRNRSP